MYMREPAAASLLQDVAASHREHTRSLPPLPPASGDIAETVTFFVPEASVALDRAASCGAALQLLPGLQGRSGAERLHSRNAYSSL